jgi:hypothetical protein
MRSSSNSWWWTPAIAIGAALLAWPWLSGPRPNPLPARFDRSTPGAEPVGVLLRRLDASCGERDLDGFASLVTPRFLQRWREQLARAGVAADGSLLAEYAVGQGGFAAIVDRPHAVGSARRDRVALVAPATAGRSGAQGVAMVWDGERLLLDAVGHGPDVFVDDAPAVDDLARTLLQTRSPAASPRAQ